MINQIDLNTLWDNSNPDVASDIQFGITIISQVAKIRCTCNTDQFNMYIGGCPIHGAIFWDRDGA